MKYLRFLGSLDENLKINNGVLIDLDRIAYYSGGKEVASITVNNPKCLDFPALHTEMRGKFISAVADGETCANGVKRALKTGEIEINRFIECKGFRLDEQFVQEENEN